MKQQRLRMINSYILFTLALFLGGGGHIVFAEPAPNTTSQATETSPKIPGPYEDGFTAKKGGLYSKDPNVWVYSKAFAERFGMPPQWIPIH